MAAVARLRCESDATYVRKTCAYITREPDELLVFEGPDHDGYQVPKGTVETGETPREAVFREIAEESGLGIVGPISHLASDVWGRRESPPRWYVRSFFHTTVHEYLFLLAPGSEEVTANDSGRGSGAGVRPRRVDSPTSRRRGG